MGINKSCVLPPPNLNMNKSTWNVGLLSFFTLVYTAWNTLRTIRSLIDWQTLVGYGAPAGYIFITGLFGASIGCWLLWNIGKSWPHTWRAGIAISVLYWVWYWTDRLLLQSTPAPNMLFSLIFSGILLVIVVFLWRSPNTKAFFIKETE